MLGYPSCSIESKTLETQAVDRSEEILLMLRHAVIMITCRRILED